MRCADPSSPPPAGARLPLAATRVDEHGTAHALGTLIGAQPALLVLADYTCRTLCGPVLAIAADGLARTGLGPGADFSLIVVGLDPNDSADATAAMKRDQIGDSPIAAAATFLRGDETTVAEIAHALG